MNKLYTTVIAILTVLLISASIIIGNQDSRIDDLQQNLINKQEQIEYYQNRTRELLQERCQMKSI